MDVAPVTGRMAERQLGIFASDIASVLGAPALAVPPVIPGIAKSRAQGNRIKARNSIIAKERIIEFSRSVLAFEHKPKRMFGVFLGASAVPSLQPKATIDLEFLSAIAIKEFHRCWPFPAVSETGHIAGSGRAGIDIYSTCFRIGTFRK